MQNVSLNDPLLFGHGGLYCSLLRISLKTRQAHKFVCTNRVKKEEVVMFLLKKKSFQTTQVKNRFTLVPNLAHFATIVERVPYIRTTLRQGYECSYSVQRSMPIQAGTGSGCFIASAQNRLLARPGQSTTLVKCAVVAGLWP